MAQKKIAGRDAGLEEIQKLRFVSDDDPGRHEYRERVARKVAEQFAELRTKAAEAESITEADLARILTPVD